MKWLCIPVCCLLVMGFPAGAGAQAGALQPAERSILNALPNDMARVDSLNEWAFHARGDSLRMASLASQALQLAMRIGYRKGEADSYMRLGTVWQYYGGDYRQAADLYAQAREIRLQLRDSAGAANVSIMLGHLQANLGNYSTARDLYASAAETLKQFSDEATQVSIAKTCNSLGSICVQLGEYGRARDYFDQSLVLYARLAAARGQDEVREGLASCRINISSFLQDNLGRFSEARDSLLKTLSELRDLNTRILLPKCHLLLGNNAYYQQQYPQALAHYDSALACVVRPEKRDFAILLKNKGRVYLDQRKYRQALALFQESLDSFLVLGHSREIASTRFEIGNYYYEQDQYPQAISAYQEALRAPFEDPLLRGRLLFFLADAYSELGDQDASERMAAQFVAHLDALQAGQTKGAYLDLLRYQIGRQRLLKEVVQLKRQADKRRSVLLLSAAGALLLLALAGGFLLNQKRRIAMLRQDQAQKDAELARNNAELANQKVMEIINTRQLEHSLIRQESQEETQRAIGQELHDGVGALLTTVKLNLASLDENLHTFKDETRQQFFKANQLLEEATSEIRRISHSLTDALLEKFGLKAQLEGFIDAIATASIEVELVTTGLKERLSSQLERSVFRIVQELVNNVIKHAGASRISIQVNRFPDLVNILVEDNGKGFDATEAGNKPGMGLLGIRARLRELSGEMVVDSSPGRGTTISIDIPL